MCYYICFGSHYSLINLSWLLYRQIRKFNPFGQWFLSVFFRFESVFNRFVLVYLICCSIPSLEKLSHQPVNNSPVALFFPLTFGYFGASKDIWTICR